MEEIRLLLLRDPGDDVWGVSAFSQVNVWYHAVITLSSTGAKSTYTNGTTIALLNNAMALNSNRFLASGTLQASTQSGDMYSGEGPVAMGFDVASNDL